MASSESCFRFPLDLEYKIFRLAAKVEYRRTAYKLCFVSRRVYEWIRPILYESVALSCDPADVDLCHALQKLPRSFLEAAVKAVFLLSDETVCFDILRICTSVDVLSINTRDVPFEVVSNLRPTILLFQPSNVVGIDEYDLASTAFFSQITHLEMFRLQPDFPYHLIPRLTHLAFDSWAGDHIHATQINQILQSSPNIQVLVILCQISDGRPQGELLTAFAKIYPDVVRRVYLGEKQSWDGDWLQHINGLTTWDRARPLLSFEPEPESVAKVEFEQGERSADQ